MAPLARVLYLWPLTGPVCTGRRRKWLYWPLHKHYIRPERQPACHSLNPFHSKQSAFAADNAPVPSSVTTLKPQNNREITLKAVCSGISLLNLSSWLCATKTARRGKETHNAWFPLPELHRAAPGGGVAGDSLVRSQSWESWFLWSVTFCKIISSDSLRLCVWMISDTEPGQQARHGEMLFVVIPFLFGSRSSHLSHVCQCQWLLSIFFTLSYCSVRMMTSCVLHLILLLQITL